MKYCEKCGKELLDEAVVCPGCGCAVKQSAAEKPMASYDYAARSLVTNIISGIVLVIGIFVALYVHHWVGIFLCLAAELIAATPLPVYKIHSRKTA